MELIPVGVELEPTLALEPSELTCGEGADGTEGFPEDVRETELLTLDTGTLLLFILLAMWSTELTNGLESAHTYIQTYLLFSHRTSSPTELSTYDDSLEGKMAADPLKNKKMLNKSTNFRSKSFFWCSSCKSVDR
jgi:hypothetical protein